MLDLDAMVTNNAENFSLDEVTRLLSLFSNLINRESKSGISTAAQRVRSSQREKQQLLYNEQRYLQFFNLTSEYLNKANSKESISEHTLCRLIGIYAQEFQEFATKQDPAEMPENQLIPYKRLAIELLPIIERMSESDLIPMNNLYAELDKYYSGFAEIRISLKE